VHRIIIVSSAGLLVALASPLASADTQNATFDPSIEWRPTEFPFESGYIPATGPLRVNLGAAAFQEVVIEMQGDAAYDWDALALAYEGYPDGGHFRNTLGAEVTATIAIDAFGFQTEFEVGIWDIAEHADANFDPYVLPGNPVRPITVSEDIGPYNLVTEPFSVGPATGTLEIDYMFEVPGISFAGTRIDLDAASGPADVMVTHDLENESLAVMLPSASVGETTSVWATMNGEFSSSLVLHLYPTVTVDILGAPLEIGPFDVAVAYPVLTDEPIVFEDVELQYDVPEPPAPGTTDDGGADETTGGEEGGTDDGAGADETTGTPTDDDGETDDGSDDEESGGGEGGAVGEQADGCGCTTAPSPTAGLWALLGLIAVRRRRG